MLDVACATLGQREPRGLEHIPGPYRLLINNKAGWALAANELLDESSNDVLFLDDDVELTSDTFMAFDWVAPKADVIGFTLLTNGLVTSAGYQLERHQGNSVRIQPRDTVEETCRPGYVAHVTASCMFVKQSVVGAGLRFPVWPGQHYEDVAFTLECWRRGFRVVYCPGVVYHHMSGSGVGATKACLPDFEKQRTINQQCLTDWFDANDIAAAADAGLIPWGTWRLG